MSNTTAKHFRLEEACNCSSQTPRDCVSGEAAVPQENGPDRKCSAVSLGAELHEVKFGDARLDKLINLNELFGKMILTATENKQLLRDEIARYLTSQKDDDSSFYRLMFLRCLEKYLDSGIEFKDRAEISEFYRNTILQTTEEVPWFVGLMQSYIHLKTDTPFKSAGDTSQKAGLAGILVSLFNERRFTELCLRAIRRFTVFPYRTIVVNNSDVDMQDFRNLVFEERLADGWFDSGTNSHAKGLQRSLSLVAEFRYIATLDNDAVVLKKGWLSELIKRLNQAGAALIGPQTFPGSNTVKGFPIHPCCMVIDQTRIGSKFQLNFLYQWPCDVGQLLTWDCLAHGIPIVKVSHDLDGNYATGSSLINKSVRHYWYASRILGLDDETLIDGWQVRLIREKLEKAYGSAELNDIRKYRVPQSRPT